MVSAADRAEITRRLRDIERAHGLRILLAVESGSRAWGFPSQDSDFDVRFLYVHPTARYLSVAPLRDVVEPPFDPPFDLGGWDLRKAAWMLCRSNATVIEWAGSPVRYLEVDGLADRLTGLADAVVNREALAYHYDRMTRRAWEAISPSADAVPLKRYCYALRAVLAKLWVTSGLLPPMDLPSLLEHSSVTPGVRAASAILVAAKAAGDETAEGLRSPALDGLIAGQLEGSVARPAPALPTRQALELADALVQAFVSGSY